MLARNAYDASALFATVSSPQLPWGGLDSRGASKQICGKSGRVPKFQHFHLLHPGLPACLHVPTKEMYVGDGWQCPHTPMAIRSCQTRGGTRLPFLRCSVWSIWSSCCTRVEIFASSIRMSSRASGEKNWGPPGFFGQPVKTTPPKRGFKDP